MSMERTPETPEERIVDGLLGTFGAGESERLERRVRGALAAVRHVESERRRRMRLWRGLGSAVGAAAIIMITVLVLIGNDPSTRSAVAALDRSLERIDATEPTWYEVVLGERTDDVAAAGFEGRACIAGDGRFVAFLHRPWDEKKRGELIVGNDGMEDWVLPTGRMKLPESMSRRLFERLRTTVASGSIDPARILRLVRQGWNLERIDTERAGRPVTRVEASLPKGRRDRGVIDRIVLELDPESYALDRLEASRLRDGTDDPQAYLLFQRTASDGPIAGFALRDHLRTDRPRDPDPGS